MGHACPVARLRFRSRSPGAPRQPGRSQEISMNRALGLATVLAALASAAPVRAFAPDSLVRQKCSGCHAPGADGRLARIEEIRTTPEEWTVIVDRMRRLHGMPLTRAEMGRLLKELCSTQILTPDEQAKVAYLSLFHNAQQMEAPDGPDEPRMFAACVRCHTAGKIRSYRMTAENWAKLRDFHLWVDPALIYQMREMHWREEAAAVLQEMPSRYGYGQAWRAPAANLSGEWSVFGYEPGKGNYRGEVEMRGGADGEYALHGHVRHADGTVENFHGEATLYGGYALRTRTRIHGRGGGDEVRGAFIHQAGRLVGESHFPAPHFRTSKATWVRRGGGPRVVRVTPGFLLSNEITKVWVEGVGLPAVKPGHVSFSGGSVRVLSARHVGHDVVELQVYARTAKVAVARLRIRGLDAGQVTLAPAIDHIEITPAVGRARLSSGPRYPAEGVQFEAVAYARPADPASGAGVPLGPVPASFDLAEEKTRENDDDLQFLQPISSNGSYLPRGDYRPLPSRAYSVEGSGLVKVVASYRRGHRRYTAEAQLAVTVPDFVQRIR